MTDIRVLILADNLLARVGLAALLGDQAGCIVVGQLSDVGLTGDTLSNELDLYRPDVLLYDLGWNPAPAVVRLRVLIADLDGEVPLVALLPDDSHAAEALSVFRERRAGGVLLRESPPETLVMALRAATSGMIVVHPALATAVLPSVEIAETSEGVTTELTPREREVLQLISEGLPNKAIAAKLNISEHTVKFHVNALLNKLGAQSRTEAVVRATRLGLIML
jgi:DNA-binding NarL/FixJ family response regulator